MDSKRARESAPICQWLIGYLFLTAMASGCATIGDIGDAALTPWPLPEQSLKSVTVSYAGGLFNEKPEARRRHYIGMGMMCRSIDEFGTINCQPQRGVPEVDLQPFRESGLFSAIKAHGVPTDTVPSDVQVNLKVIVREQPVTWGALVVGFTLLLAPGKVIEREIVVRATFKDRTGKVLGRIEKKGGGSTYAGLLSLLILPFRDRTFEQTETDLVKSLLIDAKSKGLLDVKPAVAVPVTVSNPPAVVTSGTFKRIETKLLEGIQKGKTSKAQIEQTLGEPQKINGNELASVPGAALLYQYLWEDSKGNGEAVLVWFDRNNVVLFANQARVGPAGTTIPWMTK
jgi:hypothetical protein